MCEAIESAWVTPAARPRRRLVLPPLRPVLSPVIGSPVSGSRFDPIYEVSDDDDGISVAEEVAWCGLEDEPRVMPLRKDGGLDDGE
jgi:hypothetical protein